MNYMTIAGSDDYMAPEVLLGEKYDEKCDVFGYAAPLLRVSFVVSLGSATDLIPWLPPFNSHPSALVFSWAVLVQLTPLP
jgi:serine/threonine protein kinase